MWNKEYLLTDFCLAINIHIHREHSSWMQMYLIYLECVFYEKAAINIQTKKFRYYEHSFPRADYFSIIYTHAYTYIYIDLLFNYIYYSVISLWLHVGSTKLRARLKRRLWLALIYRHMDMLCGCWLFEHLGHFYCTCPACGSIWVTTAPFCCCWSPSLLPASRSQGSCMTITRPPCRHASTFLSLVQAWEKTLFFVPVELYKTVPVCNVLGLQIYRFF